MRDGARALLTAEHVEVALVAVQVGQEHDARLVEAGRGLEDVARQLNSRREDRLIACDVTAVQRSQGGRGGRRNGVEDAQQRITVGMPVAQNE